MADNKIKPGFYRHHKGKLVCVHDCVMATHTETKEKFVIFSDSNRRVWVQPMSMFEQKIKVKNKTVRRFSKEGD